MAGRYKSKWAVRVTKMRDTKITRARRWYVLFSWNPSRDWCFFGKGSCLEDKWRAGRHWGHLRFPLRTLHAPPLGATLARPLRDLFFFIIIIMYYCIFTVSFLVMLLRFIASGFVFRRMFLYLRLSPSKGSLGATLLWCQIVRSFKIRR